MSDVRTTTEGVRPASMGPLPHWGRKVGLLFLTIVVVAGALGVFGVHTRSVTRSNAGWTLTLTYPQVARAGLDVEWRARLHHPGGVHNGVTLAITADYLDIFDGASFIPQPDSETSDGRFVYLRYDSPPGSSDFQVTLDAYIQPASQQGKRAEVIAYVNSAPVARTRIHTWLFP
jgi:hypothetical protein